MADSIFNILPDKKRPFILKNQDAGDVQRLKLEVMDKVNSWENRQSNFFNEYAVYRESWRVQPLRGTSKRPSGLFDSKSGETHRATETLATLWFRMLTALDPFFNAYGEGVNEAGEEMSEGELFAVETVLEKQLEVSRFKEKLLRVLNSVALFGTAIVEEPFVSLPYGDRTKTMEYTDFILRSLIMTGFDTSVLDIDMSDYIFTIDYPTKWKLRNWSTSEDEVWDRVAMEKHFVESGDNVLKTTSQAYSRLTNSKQRAGYIERDTSIHEQINYHGRLDVENPVIGRLWDSLGRKDDPKFIDFSVGILDGVMVDKFHKTQFDTWHSRFKILHYKLFEFEPLGYGVGKIGRKKQREMDITESRTNDILMFSLYSMWKVGRFAGLKANQLNIKPWNLIELDDINQLEPIRPDIAAIQQSLQMMNIWREDFRQTVGAGTNLQAQITKASATESAIAQNEAIRGGSVHAEVIALPIKEHINTMHVNNLAFLDEPIWVASTGQNKPQSINRENLPQSVGFKIKIVTDKDSRPERLRVLLEGMQMVSSIRQDMPSSLNMLRPMAEEWFRLMDLDPRSLNEPVPVGDQLEQASRELNRNGGVQNEVQGEIADEESGAVQQQQTPVGPVGVSQGGVTGL